MRSIQLFLLVILTSKLLTGCKNDSPTIPEENIAVQKEVENTLDTFKFQSDILNQERLCYISLPDNYATKENFPLIILLDGYTFFKTAKGVVQFMSSDRNRNFFMPESIIVAIENIDREHDLTVTKIQTKRENTMGGGRKFLEFIQTELIPYVDQNYKTTNKRTLIGHSLGGLLAVNSYIDPNSIFDAFLAIDPSIFWDEEFMDKKVDSISQNSLAKKLYIATANQGEANQGKNKMRHERLVSLIDEKLVDKNNLGWEYFEDEDHRSVPLIAMYKGLKFLNSDN